MIMTLFSAPITNNKNITFDQKYEKVGFDCPNASAVIIQAAGFFNGKQVGTSPLIADWKARFLPVSPGMSQKVLGQVCSATAAGSASSGGGQPSGSSAVGAPNVGVTPPAQTKLFTGSGIVVNGAGYLLTNVHVVNGCSKIVANVVGLGPVPAVVEAMDPKDDLALLRTLPGYGAPAQFRSQSQPARLGESVAVIGYPLNGLLSSEPKATFGEVSSEAGVNNDYTQIQISAPVQPGNSGGPVFDASGKVIGIVVSQVSYKVAAITGSMPQNLNFAIRGEIAQIFMTAHGLRFDASDRGWRLQTDEIAERGERSTVQVFCTKP
jgi:S1-C subfamily serine protease